MGQWEVAVDGKWVSQPVVTISCHIHIIGATGENGSATNGEYKATTELSGDMPVYVKVGDGDKWLEYHAGSKKWQAKITASKGKNHCYAFCEVPAKCLPQDCPVGQWQVAVDGKWVKQPEVTISLF